MAGQRRRMKVHFARTRVPNGASIVDTMIDRLAGQAEPQRHVGTADPAEADVILFPDCHLLGLDWRLTAIATTDLARRYPEKVAVYDERDVPWCRFPGIYVSMPSPCFDRTWQVAGSYYTIEDPTTRLDGGTSSIEQDLLFGFVGGRTHPCRDAVFALDADRAHVESTEGFVFYDPTSLHFAERRRNFAEIVFRSKFVLCPRGWGTSSIRLYETMAAGRAPVIIADEWVPPTGPDWSAFSITWPEGRIAELPRILAEREADAEEMGRRARLAFDSWFAPAVVLSRQLDQLEERLRPGGFVGFPSGGVKDAQYRRALVANARTRYHEVKAKVAGVVRR